MNGLGRLFWRVLDRFEYWVMHTRLRIVDAVCGPEPETEADQQRRRDRDDSSEWPN
jgi:hypothetical protein